MMSQSELLVIDEWRRQQPNLSGRADAMRRLIQLGFTAWTINDDLTQALEADPNFDEGWCLPKF